jgi:HK97 family phage major capsid protein
METGMVEVKADALEQSFEALEDEDTGISLREELDLLKARVAEGLIAGARPALEGVKSGQASAFTDRYLRRGIDTGLEAKSLDDVSGSTGGFAIPREIDEKIDHTLATISPIRAIANVVKVGSSNYRKLITVGGAPSGWVGFEAARPETATPVFTEVVPASGDLYANPAASQHMLDDAMFDVESWLADEIATEFARAEGAAFVKGTGVNQPLGFLSSPNAATADATRPIGTLQTIGTGAAGAFPATNPQDKLIDLVHSLRQPYRQGAVFVMNSATAAVLRKMKTNDGAFLWQPSLVAGQPSTLLGYPVIEAEDMPDIAANSLSIAFGNFKAGYIITEQAETSILRDPYTKKPYVYFYATQALDVIVHGVVQGSSLVNEPPASPKFGETYLVGATPVAAWQGYPNHVAYWTEGGWRFRAPFQGLELTVRSNGLKARFDGREWQLGIVAAGELRIGGERVVSARQPAIARPVGGSLVDTEARTALLGILAALESHGLIAKS